MQTFLPYPGFVESARVLDMKRLGKQRVETLQIMRGIFEKTGWSNHPITKMWRGYEWALLHYQQAIVDEWMRRGYKDTCFLKTFKLFFDHAPAGGERNELPPWFGDEAFHRAHQSNLVRKKPEHYRQYFPDVPDDLPYIYPTLED